MSRAEVLDALDRALGDLASVGGLPRPIEAKEIWEGIWYEETHHSTAIEGNTLILKQVETLLGEGRAVGNKELREYLEVKGYADAADWVYAQAVERGEWNSQDEMINVTEARQAHRLAVEGVWSQFPPDDLRPGEGPGSFRQHDIQPFPGGMRPPPFPDVPSWMTDWAATVNAGPADLQHPMEFLAETHSAFERIHPFRDGNGRAGRLVMNLLLVRHGYPPVVIYKRDRSRYLSGLDRADKGDSGLLTEILARRVKESIDRFLIPQLAGPAKLVPLSMLVDADLSLAALRMAAKRGRLRTYHERGQIYSTREWADRYKRERAPQGRRAGESV